MKTEINLSENKSDKNPNKMKADSGSSLRTDTNIENRENPEGACKLFQKRSRTSKPVSKVTFDESLNMDILYDPHSSSLQTIKIEPHIERPKKAEFISVYSNRPIYAEKEDESSSSVSSEEKEMSPSGNYRPERLRINKY